MDESIKGLAIGLNCLNSVARAMRARKTATSKDPTNTRMYYGEEVGRDASWVQRHAAAKCPPGLPGSAQVGFVHQEGLTGLAFGLHDGEDVLALAQQGSRDVQALLRADLPETA